MKTGSRWTAAPRLPKKPVLCGQTPKAAQVAQMVEQRTENPRVGGSIPPLGTIYFHL